MSDDWAGTVLRAVRTPFPYQAQHTSLDDDDVDVTPSVLHPAFHGSYDWHSCVHMLWSAVRLLDEGVLAEPLTALLDERLTADNLAVEVHYLNARPSFERPYGWAWAAMLAAACAGSPTGRDRGWAAASRPLYEQVTANLRAWLPTLSYPVRHGEHSNTAFALLLLRNAAGALGDDDLIGLIDARCRDWFAADVDYPAHYEPGGSDFLSPALCEAALMRSVLGPDGFRDWLPRFLPRLGTADDPLLRVPTVGDATDGKGAHLIGLALSRAWQLRVCAPFLDEHRRERVLAACADAVDAVGRQITDGDFVATHWLVSFAILARDAGSDAPAITDR